MKPSDVIKERLADETARHLRRRRELEAELAEEEKRHDKALKKITDDCFKLTGHKDDGSMFHGFCKYCQQILE